MKSLSRLLSKNSIFWLDTDDKDVCLRQIVERLVSTAGAESGIPSSNEVYDAIQERERLLSTGFGLGLAIPHAKLARVNDFAIALGIHHDGVAYESIDDKPVHILVMILCPSAQQDEYLRVLSRVTAFLKANRESILTLDSPEEIYQLTLDY